MIGLLNSITWDVNPILFDLGALQIRYYGLLFATGFMISFYIVSYFYKRAGLKVEEVDKLTIYTILGAVLGARLGHVFFYEWAYYKANLIEIPMVWHGGLASHGGAIGILLAIFIYSKKYKRNYLWTMDRIVVPTALTGALIRLGNLMNSEIYGTPTDLPWGFIFKYNGETVPMHPTQLYESFSYLISFGILWMVYQKDNGKSPHGKLFGIFLILIFGVRFFIEFIKYHQSTLLSNDSFLNMGQVLSIPLVIAGIYFLISSKNKSVEP